MVGEWVSWPKKYELERIGPSHSLSWGGLGREKSPVLLPAVGRRAGPEFMKSGELFLPLTGYSLLESGFSTVPGQYSRASPGSKGVGEPAWRT